MNKKEFAVVFEAILAVTQNGQILDELDIFTDADWDNIDKAYEIFKKYQ